MGGVLGVIETVLPGLLFVLVFTFTFNPWLAIGVSVSASVLFTVYRLIRNQASTQALNPPPFRFKSALRMIASDGEQAVSDSLIHINRATAAELVEQAARAHALAEGRRILLVRVELHAGAAGLREGREEGRRPLQVVECEVADAAVLCPSFYKADIVQNPSWWDRLLWKVRKTVIGALQGKAPAPTMQPAE
jgi:hypothetical protein